MKTMILLQDAAPGQFGSDWISFLFMGGIVAVFYFFMIRPQQQRAREEQKFRDSLKKGDKVITIGGAYGTVESIEGDGTVMVRVDTNTRVRFEKSAIRATPASAPAEEKKA
ncbi:MAG: preprotein translocase subunit YajC [Bacteroidia bacterium]|nr:preprotein translocase subunit YajC [Bacteroidia bacterium]